MFGMSGKAHSINRYTNETNRNEKFIAKIFGRQTTTMNDLNLELRKICAIMLVHFLSNKIFWFHVDRSILRRKLVWTCSND